MAISRPRSCAGTDTDTDSVVIMCMYTKPRASSRYMLCRLRCTIETQPVQNDAASDAASAKQCSLCKAAQPVQSNAADVAGAWYPCWYPGMCKEAAETGGR